MRGATGNLRKRAAAMCGRINVIYGINLGRRGDVVDFVPTNSQIIGGYINYLPELMGWDPEAEYFQPRSKQRWDYYFACGTILLVD